MELACFTLGRTLVGELRAADQIIHDETADGDVPYLLRWFIRRSKEHGNMYLHHFLRSDFDRALHDHPWDSTSIILKGAYIEHSWREKWAVRREGDVTSRLAMDAHRIELIDGKPVWSLFITGPKIREWGFYCANGWTHNSKFSPENCRS